LFSTARARDNPDDCRHRLSGATCGPKEVPAVSLKIQEYGHLSIWLNTRGGDEADARSDHPRVHHFEIVDAKEEPDSAGKLLANDRRLMLAIGACEQDAGASTDGTNDDPAFRATVIRQRRNVFHEFELQDIHEEVDRWVVVSDNQGDEVEV
jgi:hypothetical protein